MKVVYLCEALSCSSYVYVQYIYVCVYVYAYVYVCIYVCMYIYMYAGTLIYARGSMLKHMDVRKYVTSSVVHIHIHLYKHIRKHVTR